MGRHQGDGTVKFLGYCPQENVLWPNLTVRQHLEVFATVKGLRKLDAAVAIPRYTESGVVSLCREAGKLCADDEFTTKECGVEATPPLFPRVSVVKQG